MAKLPIPANEQARLQALKSYEIMHSLSEQEYDRITRLAALICEAPISLITLLDEEQQWFKSKVGLDIDHTARELAFCQYTIMDTELFEVPNAAADERFANNQLVTSAPHIQFYAGYPLVDPQGYTLGTLCVIDRKPRQLTANQKEALRLLSAEVMQLILERRLKAELRNFEKLFLLSNDLICVSGTDGSFKKVNPAFQSLLGYGPVQMLQKNIFDLVHPEDQLRTSQELEKLKSGHSVINFEHRLQTAEGKYKIFQWFVSPEKGTDNLFAVGRDVTAMRANEDKLAEKEADLRSIVENSQGFISTHDLAGKFIAVNTAGANILGYTSQEMAHMSLFDIIPENRHPHLEAYLQQIQLTGSGSGQMHVRHRNGEIRKLLFNNKLEQREGKTPYVIGNALDITESKKMEEQLLQLSEMLEQTNQVARVGGWQLDLLTQKVYWTTVTREIHELPIPLQPDLNSGLDYYKEGQDRNQIIEAVEKAVNAGLSWDLELRIITYTGREIWVKSMGNPVFEEGQCIRLYGSMQDINVSKLAELQAERSRAILRSFALYAPAAVAMLDLQMNYIAITDRWLEDYHLKGKQIIGTSYYDHFPFIGQEGRDRHQRVLSGAIEKKEEDVYLGSPDGKPQYITWEMRPWFISENEIGGMMIFTQNISTAVQQRNELNLAKIAAEQASVAKSDFLSNMSHEIRTPLNGVIGFTDLVLKTVLTDTQMQYLSIVNQSANSLLGIINDILDFSKIEAGKLELDIEECDIYEISGQAIDIITYQVQKKGLEMLLNLSPNLPRFVWTDAVRLKQIMVNLLGNAVKFTDRGEIELKVQVLEQQESKSLFRFSVRDTGIGIKEDKQEKIFEAFSQEDASTTKKYGGTGLGLTITNKLLGLMDSRLQLQSTIGKGSEFYFEVWLRSEEGIAKSWESMSWIRQVLVVDDNSNNRKIVQEMLALKGIITHQAKNGFEALQMLAAGEKFDVIVMDYHMPYLDGIETIRKIREQFDHEAQLQPIVLLFSSSDDEKIIRACDELQVNARLAKPVKMLQLYDVLSHLLLKDKLESIPAVQQSSSITESALTILIADDNPVNMLLASTIVGRAAAQATIIQAKNGIEAVNYYTLHQPDLILMDVQMPEMNGYEATVAIRSLEQGATHIPIIALTAGNVKNERERCVASGMDDFVVKPVIESTIIQLLRKWLHIDESIPVTDQANLDQNYQHFNPNVLKGHIGDDHNVMKEIITLTKKQLLKSLEVLQTAVLQNDWLNTAAEGHKLYGTAVAAGLPRTAQIAKELEFIQEQSVSAAADLYATLAEEIAVCMKLM